MAEYANLPPEYRDHPVLVRAIAFLGLAIVIVRLRQTRAELHALAKTAWDNGQRERHEFFLHLAWIRAKLKET